MKVVKKTTLGSPHLSWKSYGRYAKRNSNSGEQFWPFIFLCLILQLVLISFWLCEQNVNTNYISGIRSPKLLHVKQDVLAINISFQSLLNKLVQLHFIIETHNWNAKLNLRNLELDSSGNRDLLSKLHVC